MKIVYVIQVFGGDWDDSWSVTTRVYTDSEKAEKYKEKYNNQLKRLKKRLGDLYNPGNEVIWNRYDNIIDIHGAIVRECKFYDKN